MRLFVIAYRRSAHDLLNFDEFEATDRERAIARRFALELSHKGDADVEVVLIEASDSAALRKSHGRYFTTPEQPLARKA